MQEFHEIDKDELIQSVLSFTGAKVNEMRMILDKILETVYGTGIDYLFYIKH